MHSTLATLAPILRTDNEEADGPEDGAVSVITSHPFIDRRLVFNWRKQEEPW